MVVKGGVKFCDDYELFIKSKGFTMLTKTSSLMWVVIIWLFDYYFLFWQCAL